MKASFRDTAMCQALNLPLRILEPAAVRPCAGCPVKFAPPLGSWLCSLGLFWGSWIHCWPPLCNFFPLGAPRAAFVCLSLCCSQHSCSSYKVGVGERDGVAVLRGYPISKQAGWEREGEGSVSTLAAQAMAGAGGWRARHKPLVPGSKGWYQSVPSPHARQKSGREGGSTHHPI